MHSNIFHLLVFFSLKIIGTKVYDHVPMVVTVAVHTLLTFPNLILI